MIEDMLINTWLALQCSDNQQSSGEIQSHVIDSFLHLSYITTSNSSVALALGVAGPWLRCENAVPSTHPESKPICIPWPVRLIN